MFNVLRSLPISEEVYASQTNTEVLVNLEIQNQKLKVNLINLQKTAVYTLLFPQLYLGIWEMSSLHREYDIRTS